MGQLWNLPGFAIADSALTINCECCGATLPQIRVQLDLVLASSLLMEGLQRLSSQPGKLRGYRIIRGREDECQEFYERTRDAF